MSGKVHVTLTDFQKKKIARAAKEGNNVKIRIHKDKLDGEDTLIIGLGEIHKLDMVRAQGKAKDIMITRENMAEMKQGGFLNFLIPAAVGLVTSLIGGSGVETTTTTSNSSQSSKQVTTREVTGDYEESKQPETYMTYGEGLYLRREGSGLYLKTGGKLYDITETKEGSGFLSAVLKVLPAIAKKILPALGIGALTGVASEGASQVIKSIAGRKGNGLYLQHGGQMYDLTDTTEGDGLLGKLFGAPGGKIPILGDIPLLGALF